MKTLSVKHLKKSTRTICRFNAAPGSFTETTTTAGTDTTTSMTTVTTTTQRK